MAVESSTKNINGRIPGRYLCLSLLFVALASKLVNSLVLLGGIAVIYRVSAAVFIGSTIVLLFQENRVGVPYSGAGLGVYILLVMAALSVFWTISADQTLRSLPDLLLNVAFFLAAVNVASRVEIEAVVHYLGLLNIVLITTTVSFLVVFGSLRNPILRATPLVFGLYATLLLPISFTRTIVAHNQREALIGTALTIINTVIIVLSAVRTALLMIAVYIFVFALCWWVSDGQVQRRLSRVGRVAAAAGPVAVMASVATSGGSVLIRRSGEFMSRVVTMDFTTMPRYQMIQVSVSAVRSHPLLGVGLQASPVLWNKTAPIHNYILDGLVSFGPIGCIAALGVLGYGVITATRLAVHGGESVQTRAYYVAWGSLTISVLSVWAMLQGNIANSTEIYAVIGVSTGLAYSTKE